MKPNSLLYNYQALVINVPGPDAITALVDQGFRSWSMRQFRLAGVQAVSPRSVPKAERDAARGLNLAHTMILNKVLEGKDKKKKNILISPEKPSFAGLFVASVFLPVTNMKEHYCIKYAGLELFDVCAFMRDVCAGRMTQELALAFIEDVAPISFSR